MRQRLPPEPARQPPRLPSAGENTEYYPGINYRQLRRRAPKLVAGRGNSATNPRLRGFVRGGMATTRLKLEYNCPLRSLQKLSMTTWASDVCSWRKAVRMSRHVILGKSRCSLLNSGQYTLLRSAQCSSAFPPRVVNEVYKYISG